MPVEESFETEFGEALRSTGGSFDLTDRNALVEGALTRGRRRLARRRATAVTASVLTLAVVGVGGAYGGGLLGGPGDSRSAVAAGAKHGPVTGKDMVRILAGLLAPGKLSHATGRGTGDDLGAYASGILDDGRGKAAISISLSRDTGGTLNQMTCGDEGSRPGTRCTRTKLALGIGVIVHNDQEATKKWSVFLRTTDGFRVVATEYNAPTAKGAQTTRTDPPLNDRQLYDLVRSDEWRRPLSQLPGKGAAAKDTAGQAEIQNGPAIRTTLNELLPAGLKVTGQGGQRSEYAYVVVNDGQGPSLVQINVQPKSGTPKDKDRDKAGGFGDGGTELPDGTRLKTDQSPGEKGGRGVVMWTADTLRPDGLRVMVSAFNTGDQQTAATRKAPALTMEQLTSIALSKKWPAVSRTGAAAALPKGN
jgi:hypothetical protein